MSEHDFDFLHGSWRVAHRYLTRRLAGCEDWISFESRMRCWPILGGAGNMDSGEIPARGYHAMTIRLHDPAEDRWSLYWLTSADGGTIKPPVTGRFDCGVGEFFGPDPGYEFPVLCRYRWSAVAPDWCRWEQALSVNDGRNWETNWYMELTRGLSGCVMRA
jgi:hypothetical protein